MLVNDVSLRNLIPAELGKGFGFFHGKPSTAFSPVAVTPDELGPAWADGKVHLPLLASINGRLLGRPNAGVDMTFAFPQLIAHAAKTRRLAAGSIVGSGTVSNKGDGGPGKPDRPGRRRLHLPGRVAHGGDAARGQAARRRSSKFGDRVRIEMLDEQAAPSSAPSTRRLCATSETRLQRCHPACSSPGSSVPRSFGDC